MNEKTYQQLHLAILGIIAAILARHLVSTTAGTALLVCALAFVPGAILSAVRYRRHLRHQREMSEMMRKSTERRAK